MVVNPYDSPTAANDSAASQGNDSNLQVKIPLWRVVSFAGTLVITVLSSVVAAYGVYQVNDKGWPHSLRHTYLILLALIMFVFAGVSVGYFGYGVARRNGGEQLRGLGMLVLAVAVYIGSRILPTNGNLDRVTPKRYTMTVNQTQLHDLAEEPDAKRCQGVPG